MTVQKEEFSISTDKEKLNIGCIHEFLSQTYWAKNIPREVVVRSIQGAMCFGVYYKEEQVGFARMITDQATFAYLADVFILPAFRGRGLSKWLVETILAQPELQGLRRIMLATRDAHGLYQQYGFTPLTIPERWMNIHFPDVYSRQE